MKRMTIFITFFGISLAITSFAMARNPYSTSETTFFQQPSIPLSGDSNNQQSRHHTDMNKRGDKAMGFSHEKTTHHFYLFKDGGAIEVNAKEAKDTESINQIRTHLSHIAQMFAEGNFSTPMLVHDELPPGSELLSKLKIEITYKYETIKDGARVRISTKHTEALSAVYDFLRYQIKEHLTGDSLEITKEK